MSAAPDRSHPATDLVDEVEIARELGRPGGADPARAREALARARELRGLGLSDVAALLRCDDPEVGHELRETARWAKDAIYGRRVVLFAPLYVSNECVNECAYCAFRVGNRAVRRRSLTTDEVVEQVRHVVRSGQKRILLVAGEGPSGRGLDAVVEAIEAIYAVREGPGEVRRVNVNVAPLDPGGFRRLKACGIGTYQLFQETYHQPTYVRMHRAGPKASFHRRLAAIDDAVEAGIDDVGIGVLLGLHDHRFEVLALLQHVRHLEQRFGVGPHTISVPRLEPAEGSAVAARPPAPLSDRDFERVVAVLRLAVPYTGIILSTRESAPVRAKALSLGVSQLSAGSCTSPGGYGERAGSTAQFQLGDHRSLDEVVEDVTRLGYVPSFCTACYRKGRTGHEFMGLARVGAIRALCLPNALLTLEEYLEDYGGEGSRARGRAAIESALHDVTAGLRREETRARLARIRRGERDLFF